MRMASIVKDDKSIEPTDDEERDGSEPAESKAEKPEKGLPPPPPREEEAGRGFFHIYKPGQGYWTRMGTVLGALLIGGLTVNFLYHHMPIWVQGAGVAPAKAKEVTIGVIAALFAVFALLVFWLINKPTNADFLIATDSEMKKVNWTSRKELIGSTKVVILFMFLIAFMLFAFDIVFGYLFYAIGVLKSKPF
jgi:preprotein translocase subunit SecE